MARVPTPSAHFASRDQETHAQRLGMWIFLATEVLLFSGLFTLYTFYRLGLAEAFNEGIRATDKVLGSLMTLILLTSSLTAALGVHALAHGRKRRSLALVGLTVLLGAAFLGVKLVEYREHFREGIWPGGRGAYLVEHDPGLSTFFNLYYLLTGTHGLHVLIGGGVLAWLASAVQRDTLRYPAVALELGVLFWHFVDIVWVFLWPAFYLSGGH